MAEETGQWAGAPAAWMPSLLASQERLAGGAWMVRPVAVFPAPKSPEHWQINASVDLQVWVETPAAVAQRELATHRAALERSVAS